MRCRIKNVTRAFTLIELLVVIAIIAILAAILFPVFAQARAQARKITGASNLRQLGTATMMYVQDYDERLPFWSWGDSATDSGTFKYANGSGIWYNAVFPYVKNVGLYQDPSDRLRYRLPDTWLAEFPPGNGPVITDPSDPRLAKGQWVSYGYNESASGNSLANYQNPSEDLMWSDCRGWLVDTWNRFSWTTDLQVRRATYTEADWIDELGGGPFPPDYAAAAKWSRHGAGSNVSYMDGHVKYTKLPQLIEIGPDNGQLAVGGRNRPQ